MLFPINNVLSPLGVSVKHGFDPNIGSPRHYWDFKDGITGLYTDTGGTTPVTTDQEFVQYLLHPKAGSEAMTGINGGLRYNVSETTAGGQYTGKTFSCTAVDQALRGQTDYQDDETLLCIFAVDGATSSPAIRSIMGKTGNKGQVFYNGNTTEMSVYNNNGSFTTTGQFRGITTFKLCIQHYSIAGTYYTRCRSTGSYNSISFADFTTTAAGSNWLGKFEIGHDNSSGFTTRIGHRYIAFAAFNSLISDSLINQYFNYWVS